MAAVQFTNYFATELAAPVAPGDTTIQVLSDGNLGSLIVGGNWIYLTLVDANSWNNNLIPPATREIVKVTAISGSAPDFILTVTRSQDNTTAQSFSKCDIAAFLLNAQSLYDITTSPGSGTVTSVAAAAPITATPSNPITTTGTIGITDFVASGSSHARGSVPDPGSVAGTTKFLREDATWAVPAGGGGSVSITATTPVVVTPSPLTGTGVVSHANSGVTAATYGDSTHVAQITINATGHITAASNVAVSGSGGGTSQSQEFTSSGTFNVPSGVTLVWVEMVGGGGGGSTLTGAVGGGGGGAGEQVQSLPITVTSSGTVTVTIGAAGTGAAGGGVSTPGGNGGDTSFGSFSVRGGVGGLATGVGGAGGGAGGSGAGGGLGNPGTMGLAETPVHFGGGGGGGGSSGTSGDGGAGAPCAYNVSGAAGGTHASTQGGGGGGSNTQYGIGGAGGGGGADGASAASTSYGAGGGGAGGKTGSSGNGGNGAKGYVKVQWVG